uniref:Uncharacterized protein n=1 Tax=Cajanus cajan TaxID=3821 RepID=A0A151SRD7_CAJCA|nr:hypothetical protein KK1_003656 [Cajanus cajan]
MRKLKGNERISMGRNVSALIGKSVPHIPEKCKDPGTFCIPCIIGKSKFENAMLDLGASINVMPLSFCPIILGKPFLKISRTKIDVYVGTLSMEFGDIIVHFIILDAMKFLSEAHYIFCVELIDDLVDEPIHYFDSSHAKKHSFLFDLYSCLPCIESESESEYESESKIDCHEAYEFDTLGVVPFGLDFIESECITHVARSTKESDL